MPDNHGEYGFIPDRVIESAQNHLFSVIFPNNPRTQREKEAFKAAVMYQAEHEVKMAEQRAALDIPEGVQSFSIGHFSATLGSDYSSAGFTIKDVCKEAYAVLLREGLLYRGVEGRN